jgi:hypothetical protein
MKKNKKLIICTSKSRHTCKFKDKLSACEIAIARNRAFISISKK